METFRVHENPMDQPLSTHGQDDQGRDLPRQQHPSRVGPKTGLCCAEIWQGWKKKGPRWVQGRSKREQQKTPGRGSNRVKTASILAHNYNAIVFYVPDPPTLGAPRGPEGVLPTTYQSKCVRHSSAENPGLPHFKEEPGRQPTVCTVAVCRATVC